MNYEIRYYRTENEKCPFNEWVNGIDDTVSARILSRIDRISDGNFGDHSSVGDGVWELRLFFGSGYRVYYTVCDKKIVVLLCGGDKSSQSRDVRQAKIYLADFIRRMS